MIEIKDGRSQQILTAINFYLDVQLGPVIYRDARNKKRKTRANSNVNNVLLGRPIESHNILRRSK